MASASASVGAHPSTRGAEQPKLEIAELPSSGNVAEELLKVQASLDRVQGNTGSKVEGPVGATYNAERVLGSGAFGIVYQARIIETNEMVAIKKVLQDARFKNRELEIMQELKHPNVVELKSAFHVPGDKPRENYLNVVMEYCPETMHNLMSHYAKSRRAFPYELVQIYTYHMLRGVAYLNAKNICHRDIKPPNLLIKEDTHELKICDFGSAKRLSKGEPNVAYICSRYYRAPELIFGATNYSTLIDMWSVACVTAEMILQQVLFPGDSGVDQLMEIIKVLGTPSVDDLNSMNPVYGEFKFPQIKSYPWTKIFRSRTSPEAVDWLSKVLQYDPKKRPTGLEACMHKFFHDLRSAHFKTATPLSMFWFSDEEMALMNEDMRKALIPGWVKIEQGGEVPRALGIAKRPDVESELSGGALPLQGTSAAVSSSARPSLPSRRREAKNQEAAEDGSPTEPTADPANVLDPATSSQPGDEHSEPRRPPRGERSLRASGDSEPVSPTSKGRRSPRPKEGSEGGERERPRKVSSDGGERERHRKVSADGNCSEEGASPRREKRKGRERGEKRHEANQAADVSVSGAPQGTLSAREPGSAPCAIAPASAFSARGSGSARASGEGDALAEFSHASALLAAGGPSAPVPLPNESQSEARSKHGGLPAGLLPLASAGAMQLVPAAATAPSQHK